MTTDHGQGFTEDFHTSDDGLALYARIYGGGNGGTPIVCLPGLSRNSRDFHQLALFLASTDGAARRVICLDFRGRGRSAYDTDPGRYNIGTEAADVLAVCRGLGISQADFIGTSRGGLVMHILAATAPDLLGRLVLNDIGPEIALEGLRQIQAYLGRQRPPADWDDAVIQLREVHGAAFPALAAHDWRDMAHAIYRQTGGVIVADFDPAIAAQLQAADLSKPLPDLWPQFDAFTAQPLMVIRGEHSRLLTAETVERMAERHSGLDVLVAKGQGHAPILHVDGLAQRIAAFLAGESLA